MGYRNPGPSQRTNIRMNGRMTHHLEEGGRIEVATIMEATVWLSQRVMPLEFSDKATRRLIEAASLIVAVQEEGVRVENL